MTLTVREADYMRIAQHFSAGKDGSVELRAREMGDRCCETSVQTLSSASRTYIHIHDAFPAINRWAIFTASATRTNYSNGPSRPINSRRTNLTGGLPALMNRS